MVNTDNKGISNLTWVPQAGRGNKIKYFRISKQQEVGHIRYQCNHRYMVQNPQTPSVTRRSKSIMRMAEL